MKPPRRPRLAPARYVTGPGEAAAAAAAEPGPGPGPGSAAWSGREKRALLAALRAQAARRLPELQPRLLRERLPRRSEEEILRFVGRLRGRAAREAVSTRYRLCLEQQRRHRSHPPAPIEVWLELAETLGEGLEEVTAAAFSQVLTVAATEPLNLLHSVPPPRPPALPEEGRGDTAGTPPRTPPPPAPPSGDFAVDFARLYEFLARLCRGGGAPPLPPAEAAVLLALLGSLPPELAALDVAALRRHLRGSYSALRAPRPPPSPPRAPSDPPAERGWGGVGLCPLNLFLLPLRLLRRPQPPGTPPVGE